MRHHTDLVCSEQVETVVGQDTTKWDFKAIERTSVVVFEVLTWRKSCRVVNTSRDNAARLMPSVFSLFISFVFSSSSEKALGTI